MTKRPSPAVAGEGRQFIVVSCHGPRRRPRPRTSGPRSGPCTALRSGGTRTSGPQIRVVIRLRHVRVGGGEGGGDCTRVGGGGGGARKGGVSEGATEVGEAPDMHAIRVTSDTVGPS